MKKRSLVAASAAAALGLLVTAAPSMARPAMITVDWGEVSDPDPRGGGGTCQDPTVVSDKDISNLVYVIDGQWFTIEFSDEEQDVMYTIDGAVTEVWVKSGNNASGDGSGWGEHFVSPCDDDGGGDPPTSA